MRLKPSGPVRCTMTDQMSTAAAPQPEKKGELARLTGVVWEPGATFPDIAAHPRWWPPVLIIIVLSLTFTYSFTQRVGWDRFMRQQFETNPRTQNMDAAQRDQAIAAGAKFAPIMGYVGAAVGFPLMALAAAGVFLFVFRILLGAELSFRQVFAVYCYAMIPLIFSSVMGLAVMFLKDPEQFDLNSPTLTNIGAFLDPLNTPKWLHSLASSIDVFTLWILALLATGLAAAARKISWSTSMAAVVGTWVVYVLLKAGWAAMFG
jgi:Yip1-like protein